jgi:MFS family permease
MTAGIWIQTLTMGWLVYDLTGSPLLLGFVSGVRAIPSLFAAPIAGVMTDRANRKMLMLISQTLVLTSILLLGILVATDLVQVWHVFVLGLTAGLGNTFNNPSRQSLVATLVPQEELMNAYALNSIAFQATRVVGPAIGGFLIVWFGIAGNFFIQSAAILGVIAMVAMMRVPPMPPKKGKLSIGADMREGFKYVRQNEVVLGIMIVGIIPAFLSMPLQSLMPIFAADVLHIGADGLGILMAVMGAGALTCSVVVATMSKLKQKGLVMLVSLVGMGITLILFSQSVWLPISLVFMLFFGAGEMGYRIMNNTLLQTVVPDEFRGRVVSIYMLDQGMSPLGSMVAGAMAATMGAPIVLTIMGLCVVGLAATALIQLPYMRQLS